jgi:hypothetical protein
MLSALMTTFQVKKLIRLSVYCINIMIICMLFGCAAKRVQMYPGEVLEQSKIAIIEGGDRYCSNQSGQCDIRIISVDGHDTANFFQYLFGGGFASEVSVLPGIHLFHVRAGIYGGSTVATSSSSLQFSAEPGQTYIIKVDDNVEKNVFKWSVEEKGSGNRLEIK